MVFTVAEEDSVVVDFNVAPVVEKAPPV